MIIFDNPYVSDVIASYAAQSKTPVLDNTFARDLTKSFDLNLMDGESFAAAVNSGKRLYTVSENALDWVYSHIADKALIKGIQTMKDKHALRAALKPMYPDYFFRQVPVARLRDIDVSSLAMPFILKPSVGFYSVGVYSIMNEQDWRAALEDIDRNTAAWKERYPASVLGNTNFLLESLIKGDEYAVDVYFDENGEAVIVNIMKHDFASAKDVSDRLYYTSAELVRDKLEVFTRYFTAMNHLLGVKNFPAHIEIRLTENGTIIPIECNPMRFSGWCTTDLVRFAFGIRTYELYLERRAPDWESLLAGKEGKIYSMIILDKPAAGIPKGAYFDYEAVNADFTKVLHLRRMEKPEYPMFGFVFAQTPANNRGELDRIMRSDLSEYLKHDK